MLPVLFGWGSFAIHTYGVTMALGAVALIFVSWSLAERFGIDPDKHYRGAIYLAIAGVVGPKLFAAIQGFHFYLHHPLALVSNSFLTSGGIFLGGIVCGLAVLLLYVHYHHLDGFAVGDALAPGIAIGQSIGRVGCFSAGCCWGKPTTGFFGYTFHSAYAHLTTGVPLGVELYPTQLLMAAGQFAIFLWLWRVTKRRAFSGQIMALYMIGYGVFRFLIDFLRFYVPSAMLFGGLLTDAQFTCLFLIAAGIATWALRSRRQPSRAAVAA